MIRGEFKFKTGGNMAAGGGLVVFGTKATMRHGCVRARQCTIGAEDIAAGAGAELKPPKSLALDVENRGADEDGVGAL